MTAESQSPPESPIDADLEATLDRIMAELDARKGGLPEDAIRQAQRFYEEITPRLIRAIESATVRAKAEDMPPGHAHFLALVLLTEFRAKEALPAIREMLELPDPLINDLLDDAVTEIVPSVLATLADDTPELIDELIRNRSANSFVRWSAADALRMLVRDGRLSREQAIAYVREDLRMAVEDRDEDAATALVSTLGRLGAQEAIDEVRAAFELELVDDSLIDLEEAEGELASGEMGCQKWQETLRPSEIDDTVEYLRSWDFYSVEEDDSDDDLTVAEVRLFNLLRGDFLDDELDSFSDGEEADYASWSPKSSETFRHAQRRIGRNERCPCGSGKKFKKCCGRNSS